MVANKESLIDRLRVACNGLPGAVIAWPHRILHEAAETLTAANARIAELEGDLREYRNLAETLAEGNRSNIKLASDLLAAERRIVELESEKAETVLRMATWAANTLHTCHEQCDRPLCVAHRRIAELESLLGEAETKLTGMISTRIGGAA